MLWSVFQAVVMLVQNRYQRRRMYTRIALGKNSAMDVVSGESSGTSGQLLLLYPLLFCALSFCCVVCVMRCARFFIVFVLLLLFVRALSHHAHNKHTQQQQTTTTHTSYASAMVAG